jgi:hypothetical protein
MMKKILTALLGMLFLVGLNQAQALTLNFSDMSSDETDAALLDATLDFSITANAADGGSDLLTLTLDNQTTAPNAYTIDDLFFNFTGDSSLFSFDSSNSGSGALSAGPITADGFGEFDSTIGGFGLASGGTEVWQIDLGANGITMADFDVLSTIPPGEFRKTAALKFVQGPGDDSAFGGVSTVPVPAAVWLFGSGLLGLVGIARRKKA